MNNPTDTNQASELFELCKEVYELTGWNNKEKMYWKRLIDDDSQVKLLNYGQITTRDGAMVCPLYTSDHLLEKLPDVAVEQFNDEWLASSGRDDKGSDYGTLADTPLKALLKLTIALSEAGELK